MEVDVTVQRWAATTLVMGLVGAGLVVLAPDVELARAAATAPQRLLDTRGPDDLLVLLAWVLAAASWAWGVLGLLLTGLSTLPGLAGRAASTAVLVLVPAGIRRAAAVAVGVSLIAGPVSVAPASPAGGSAVSVAASEEALPTHAPTAAPDWPTATPSATPAAGPEEPGTTSQTPGTGTARDDGAADSGAGPVPDWPVPHPDGAHVVLRGDTLWHLATARLVAADPAVPPSAAAVAAEVRAWWQANSGVIGADPDLLLPGQVLVPPP